MSIETTDNSRRSREGAGLARLVPDAHQVRKVVPVHKKRAKGYKNREIVPHVETLLHGVDDLLWRRDAVAGEILSEVKAACQHCA